jgi:hypothetical protein
VNDGAGAMNDVNWTRFTVGVLIAAAILLVSDSILHQRVVTSLWHAVYDNLGAAPPDHSGSGIIWFALYETGRGFLAMFLYVLLRPRLGAGVRTAAWAGLVTWSAFSLAGPAQLVPIGFSGATLWASIAAWQLVFTIIAAIAGAAIYRSSRG